jgi:hypothetical protein
MYETEAMKSTSCDKNFVKVTRKVLYPDAHELSQLSKLLASRLVYVFVRPSGGFRNQFNLLPYRS